MRSVYYEVEELEKWTKHDGTKYEEWVPLQYPDEERHVTIEAAQEVINFYNKYYPHLYTLRIVSVERTVIPCGLSNVPA